VTTGKTTQVREIASCFDIHNNDVCVETPPSLTSNDGNDTITGFILGQDMLTLNGTAGAVTDLTSFNTFFDVGSDGNGGTLITTDDTTQFLHRSRRRTGDGTAGVRRVRICLKLKRGTAKLLPSPQMGSDLLSV
jgi:hypothetical protein